MPLASGTRLGPYEVLAPLGAGGMGEVYRARDTRLGRDVAIKVLPQHLSADAEVRARFEREARTISALNHPHICTLFDVGRERDTDYLVMELVEGETLANRLTRGRLPVAETLRLGAQIAGALEQAHRAGVVHRDLKPGNVMLTRAGAKLMDFGLARAAGLAGGAADAAQAALTRSPTVAAPLTAEGTIVGTFQYMAPELLEGREADARSDLWALGCMLYEMATGARAFDGASQASLIAAIMDREPRAMTELQPVTSRALAQVVRRCLQKAPAARFQNAGDLAFTLELILAEDGGGGAAAGGGGRTPRRPARARALAGAGVLVLAAAAAFVAGRVSVQPTGGSIRVTPLTHGSRDCQPAVSPDGRLVAFSAVRPGGGGIWITDARTRSETRLTSGQDNVPRFTPDGAAIVFTRQSAGRLSLWQVPAIGGPPRPLIEDAFDADCSPDGSRIAYLSGSGDSTGVHSWVMTARMDGSDARELWGASSIVLTSPRWSPDGRQIAVVRTGSQNSPNALVVVDAATGRARVFPSPHAASLSSGCWDGTGHGLLVAEGENLVSVQTGGQGQLMRLDTRSGAFRSLGWLPAMPIVMDVFRDGRIVMSTSLFRQNLREVPIGARSLAEGRWLTQGLASDRQPVYSPDGQRVLFSSNRGGALDLWEVSTVSGELRRLTDDPANDWDPSYSRDGGTIYWSSDRSHAFEIWSAHGDGSAPHPLSHDGLDAENPAATPDGRWVVYSSANPGKAGLWRIPAGGGAGERVMPGATLIPDLSPDGRLVSVITGVGTRAPKLVVFDLAQRRPLPHDGDLRVGAPGDVQPGRSRWMPDGSAIVYEALTSDGRFVLVRQPLAAWRGAAAAADTLFPESREIVESFGISPDGRRLVASVVDFLSGLSVAGGVKDIVPPRPPGGSAP